MSFARVLPARARLLGLALTVLFLGLALRRVDLPAFADELRRVNYVWLLPSALCTLLGYALRAVRWGVILSGPARAPFRTLFPVLVMGFATNNLLPGRLGELWRAYLLGRKRSVRKSSALASVIVERVFDGLVLVSLLALLGLAVRLPGWGGQIELVAGALFLGATAALAGLVWQPARARRVLKLLLAPASGSISAWADGVLGAFIDGAVALRRVPVLLGIAGLSVGVWLLEAASYLLLSRGLELGLPAGLELPAIGLTLVTINLGIMVPSAPGYVGAQEFFGTAALDVFGVSPPSALALVLVSHAVQYVLVTGLGLAFFAREHLSPRAAASVLPPQEVEQPA